MTDTDALLAEFHELRGPWGEAPEGGESFEEREARMQRIQAIRTTLAAHGIRPRVKSRIRARVRRRRRSGNVGLN